MRRNKILIPSVIVDQPSGHDHNHHVVGSDLMKGPVFGVHKIRVRHPDAVHHKVAKEHGFVEPVIKTFIFPRLAKEDVQGKVLLRRKRARKVFKELTIFLLTTYRSKYACLI